MFQNLSDLIGNNAAAFLVLGLADFFAAVLISRRLFITGSRQVMEALGPRNRNTPFYKRCSALVGKGFSICGEQLGKMDAWQRTRIKMRKAGYKSKYAPLLYLIVRFVVSPAVFTAGLILNYPEVIGPLASAVFINVAMECVVSSGRKKINLRFQKYIYKVYKYLHNQITSGIKPTDAIRSVYEVTDDKELRSILIRLAARYELTLDIDSALEEFRSNFDAHEAETLCVALKQGIETGDNKELLARQEDVMFKKYFNYVQAETDSCRNRSLAAAAVFVAIVVVMIMVPMLKDTGEAIGKIFIN
ncbi:MAG TPA: type II secretion system F family protein [Clostridia bacterium]|nr:type II secretion system F family protein [Clostridia bacterium]